MRPTVCPQLPPIVRIEVAETSTTISQWAGRFTAEWGGSMSPKPNAAARYNEKDLYQIARELQYELDKTENIGLTYISGGNPQQIRVEPDPEKLALYGVTLQQLVGKVTP